MRGYRGFSGGSRMGCLMSIRGPVVGDLTGVDLPCVGGGERAA